MRYAMCSLFLFAASAPAADPLDFSAFDKRIEVLEKKVAELEAQIKAKATAKTMVCDGETCRLVDCPAGTCSVSGACGPAGCGTSVQTPAYAWPQGATYTAPQMTTFGASGSCAGGQCAPQSTGFRGLFGRRR